MMARQKIWYQVEDTVIVYKHWKLLWEKKEYGLHTSFQKHLSINPDGSWNDTTMCYARKYVTVVSLHDKQIRNRIELNQQVKHTEVHIHNDEWCLYQANINSPGTILNDANSWSTHTVTWYGCFIIDLWFSNILSLQIIILQQHVGWIPKTFMEEVKYPSTIFLFYIQTTQAANESGEFHSFSSNKPD